MLNVVERLSRRTAWLLFAWVGSILSGGLVTSLVRAPHILTGGTSIVMVSHLLGGALVACLAVAHAIWPRPIRWWPVVLVAATAVTGWSAHRSFVPLTAAGHASLAAFATLALAGTDSSASASMPSSTTSRTWRALLARVGFGLVFVQVAAGAALRQHVIALPWHLFIGGLATLAVLGSAFAVVHDEEDTTTSERRAARSAIAMVLVQVSLGVTVLFMMLIGPPNAGSWIGITVAHVVVGSLTLLAVSTFARVLNIRSAERWDNGDRQ